MFIYVSYPMTPPTVNYLSPKKGPLIKKNIPLVKRKLNGASYYYLQKEKFDSLKKMQKCFKAQRCVNYFPIS